ncbi:MAG: DNA/RNA non-specific endonuclease, partial [Bacteroidaceae bacterium]
NIPRKGMRFTIPHVHFHYAGTAYDRGHLCPAQDFAYSWELEESTFRYYNAVPMTKNLNRGIWECYEDSVRMLSQTDSLLVICGGCDYKGGLVPKHCFKVVKSLKDGHIYYSLLFDNKKKNCKAYKCDRLLVLMKDEHQSRK